MTNTMTKTMKKCKSPYIPTGGCGNLSPNFSSASLNTLISWTDLGHPARTKVNLISTSHTAYTFCVVIPLLPVYWTTFSVGTMMGTCVPSIAPMHLSKYGANRGDCNLLWIVENYGSFGLMISIASFITLDSTLSNLLLHVPSDLSNLLSAWKTLLEPL